MPFEIAARMEYIQKVFLGTQDFMQKNPGLEEVLSYLDEEPPEYRSVAYEAASMEAGIQDLTENSGLHEWKTLYYCSNRAHSFHLEIGLGWAFAKTEINPAPYLDFMEPPMRAMVFDGIGYYYGLFRGRRTIRNHEVPAFVTPQNLPGFDQGLGRRLWYIAQGNVDKATEFIRSFPVERQPALWQGIGIACGYVGGSAPDTLENLLVASGACNPFLQQGITWAAASRIASRSITPDIDLACRIICKTPVNELILNAPL